MNSKGQALLESIALIQTLIMIIVSISVLINFSTSRFNLLINVRNNYFMFRKNKSSKIYDLKIQKIKMKSKWKDPIGEKKGVVACEYSGIL